MLSFCEYFIMFPQRLRLIGRFYSTITREFRSVPSVLCHTNPHVTRILCSRTCVSRVPLPVKVDAKMKIEFTCKVCNTRNEKYFSKTSYTTGVVIIKCDGCQSNHLIADNLNWFYDTKWNIGDILKEKCEDTAEKS